VRQFLAELPTRLTAPCQERAAAEPIRVFAQDESRVGLLPIVRRRITACGVQAIATVAPTFDNFYLYGAVEPTTGASFFLELPRLNTVTFQLWLDHFAQAFPESFNLLVLDNGAFHKAQALQWPSNVVPVFLPPYSPELNPLERVWRDLKDKLADVSAKTLAELSDAVYAIIRNYSQATLQSLTGFTYFVRAVESAQEAIYG
jgi:transposase